MGQAGVGNACAWAPAVARGSVIPCATTPAPTDDGRPQNRQKTDAATPRMSGRRSSPELEDRVHQTSTRKPQLSGWPARPAHARATYTTKDRPRRSRAR